MGVLVSPSLFECVGHWIFHPGSYVVPSSTRTEVEEYIPPSTYVPHRQAEAGLPGRMYL